MASSEVFGARVQIDIKRRFIETCALIGISPSKGIEEAMLDWCGQKSGMDSLKEAMLRRHAQQNLLLACGHTLTEVTEWQKERGDDPMFWFIRAAMSRKRAGMSLTETETAFLTSGVEPGDVDSASKAQFAAMGLV